MLIYSNADLMLFGVTVVTTGRVLVMAASASSRAGGMPAPGETLCPPGFEITAHPIFLMTRKPPVTLPPPSKIEFMADAAALPEPVVVCLGKEPEVPGKGKGPAGDGKGKKSLSGTGDTATDLRETFCGICLDLLETPAVFISSSDKDEDSCIPTFCYK
jgi:hypothetical protein